MMNMYRLTKRTTLQLNAQLAYRAGLSTLLSSLNDISKHTMVRAAHLQVLNTKKAESSLFVERSSVQ